MKKSTLVITAVVLVATYFGVSEVYAHEGGWFKGNVEQHQEMMDKKAEFLGVTPEELHEAFENGTHEELLESSGVTREDMWSYIKDEVTANWRENGLTEEEIAQRLERREGRMLEGHGMHGTNHDSSSQHGGFGRF